VIKLQSAHIEEIRGIRKLDLDFQEKTFVIYGPNGSGKSGVIDAVEFGLTGEIERLTGRGTKGLSVSEHGPHVDATDPDAAFIKLRVFLPGLGKSATITRRIKSPKKPEIVPADDDVKAAFAEIAEHPEIALSRREIIRFVLVEPTKRSEEVQSLLKLEEIGQTRNALNTAQNRLQTECRNAASHVTSCRETLQRHIETQTLAAKELLEAVNRRRTALDLPPIAELNEDTALDAGLPESAKTVGFNKESALRDLNAFSEAVKGFPDLANREAAAVVADLAQVETDTRLLVALQQRPLIEKGLNLVDGPECPLCDTPWEDEQHLREYLQAKLAKSEEALKLEQSLLTNGTAIADEVARVVGLLLPVKKLAEGQADGDFAQVLTVWASDLEALKTKLATVEGLMALKARLTGDWLDTPKALSDNLKGLGEKVNAKPDQTAALHAQTFLTTAQFRLGDYRGAMRKEQAAKAAWISAKETYDIYCSVCEEKLNTLYGEVQEDFSRFYRELNENDEGQFTAKLTPSEGKLDFEVDFYERGLFPPGAYHSEGHQDGMGVCLYLALMKRLWGLQFTFALLDDVVMSVDAGHRHQFCKLLKVHFPETQFVITTHDRLWAEQIKSAGLVTSKTSVAFHSWTIGTGPLVESGQDIWDEIETGLLKGKVPAAAAALRRHLEYVSHQLADQLGATPRFRADGDYELGELLPSVLARMKKLCGMAADAAQSWGMDAKKKTAVDRKALLSASAGALNVEQWTVNKAVHYNEWANFAAEDFRPVVVAFKDLLGVFVCETCQSWLYVSPKRVNPESLRCGCNSISFNLNPKPNQGGPLEPALLNVSS